MIRHLMAAAAVAALAGGVPALADRGPTKEEAASIAATLTTAGFKSWNKVEFDPDGPKWKVDDARRLDGKTYDVQITADTYQILQADGD